MRFLATGEEMQKIDQISIEQIGIPGLVLMERAALAVTEEIEKRFSRIKTGEHDTGRTAYTRILVVTERGNNGGDGLAVARMLAEKGYETLRESIHRQYEGGKEKWKKKTKSDCKKQ